MLLDNHLSSGHRWRIPDSLGLTHPGLYAAPANDPWGITTPPWLILPLAPIGVVGSLGHAIWCALRGQRTWKMLITAATLVAVMGCSKLLEFCLAPM